jgi:hypothetical protein
MGRPVKKPQKRIRTVDTQKKYVATTRSTAGSGFDFEDQVGARLLVRMLTGEVIPDMGGRLGWRLQSQTRALEWQIDDLLVTCGPEPDQAFLALSCKSNLQVTRAGLPHEFVSAAWKDFTNVGARSFQRSRDRLALVTRGHLQAFETVWADIKNWCTGDDQTLALARIRASGKHRTIFNNIKKVVQESSASISDGEVLEFIRHLLVISTDFDLNPSNDRELAISQCRGILASAAAAEARELWDALVERVRNARLGDGTIDLSALWDHLRRRFKLSDHPDFSSGWKLLRAYTQDHLHYIQTALPSGYSLARSDDVSNLAQAIAKNAIVVLHGESGAGKSALAKSSLQSQFPVATQVWLTPSALNSSLVEGERAKTELTRPLDETLNATTWPSNILVLDTAERIDRELALKVRGLLESLLSQTPAGSGPTWRILIVGQTEAWVAGALQGLLGDRKAASVAIGAPSPTEIRSALRSNPNLNWLALQDDAVAVLANLQALAWVMQAGSNFQQNSTAPSLTAIVDSLWKFWTNGNLALQGILIRLAEREASFQYGIALSELPAAEAQVLNDRPPQTPVRITSKNRAEFQHDLASDWARFERLKELSEDISGWAPLAHNPLWTSALRMLGQFLLRERINGRTAWDIAFEKLDSRREDTGLAADILLDSLCLDPLAESLLTERSELLFANNGNLLTRLLSRFLHIATVPSNQLLLPHTDSVLMLYMEAQNRVPVVNRWPSMVRFLAAHRDRVAGLISPIVARLCERWLTSLPVELAPGTPMPFRKELAEIALLTARVLQVAQGKKIYFDDGIEKPIYTAVLAGAPDIPEEVSAWALEIAQRHPWRADIVAELVEHQQQQATRHAELLCTNPEYRARRERLEQLPSHIPMARVLRPWPLGPSQRVENDFRECCTQTRSLVGLMATRPDVAAEVLLAVIIEDSPEEEYGGRSRPDDGLGLQFDAAGYPTAYWKSPFYNFLQVAPDVALGTLISLVKFCTERWDEERARRGLKPLVVALDLAHDVRKEFVGNFPVFDWSQNNSTHAGQLHCALAALEKWLCLCLDSGADVTAHMFRILTESRSAAVLGVLVNVGKYRPVLFEGVLRPLLACQLLYYWDASRLETLQHQFDALTWARQGETIFQLAREWWSAAYRKVPLQKIAGRLVAFKSDIAEFLAATTEKWPLPEGEKAMIEMRILKAELDRNNYIQDSTNAEGRTLVRFEYPDDLLRDIVAYQQAVAPTLRILALPYDCQRILTEATVLSEEQAADLANFLDSAPPVPGASDEEDRVYLARVAVASTLIALASQWLDAHVDMRARAREIVRIVVDQIGADNGILRSDTRRHKQELELVAHAVMHDLIRTPGSAEPARSVLRVLTSGNEAAISTLMSIGYQYREKLGDVWWRLTEIAIWWCALTVLSFRSYEDQAQSGLWDCWLGWLRHRNLTNTRVDLARMSPVAIANRVERLQRRRWARVSKDGPGGFEGLRTRVSIGLDTDLLKAIFSWLLQESTSVVQRSDVAEARNRLALLRGLLDFELWGHAKAQQSERDEPPSAIGYEIAPAVARAIPTLSLNDAKELWEPLLQLGGDAHYLIGHFINSWLQQVSRNSDVAEFSLHWRAMIEFALSSSRWSSGRRWHYGESLLCRLLGCGSELSLNQVTGLQATVMQMKELYDSWASNHLGRDEDNIASFCGFLSAPIGSSIRLDGLLWLARSMKSGARGSLQWRREGTSSAMTTLLDTALLEQIDDLKTNVDVRQAFLELSAILVARQAPTALALQERAKSKLGGMR